MVSTSRAVNKAFRIISETCCALLVFQLWKFTSICRWTKIPGDGTEQPQPPPRLLQHVSVVDGDGGGVGGAAVDDEAGGAAVGEGGQHGGLAQEERRHRVLLQQQLCQLLPGIRRGKALRLCGPNQS